jgi:catechol 2,3-dioxygenase-like lactoylglutathione lyase family enzyme
MDMKLEVVVLPVSDVDRAKTFYLKAGFRLDADFPIEDGYRIVQMTPPGSAASVIFGEGLTTANAGSTQGLHLVVTDILSAKQDLETRGLEVSEPFRDLSGAFHRPSVEKRVLGVDPERRSYSTFATFTDPDGNGWVLQEITERAPGR